MAELLGGSAYFGVVLTLGAFAAGRALQRRWNSPLANPILMAGALVMALLTALDIPVERYQDSCAPLQYLLTPATICYGLSLYEQLGRLKKNLGAIVAGVVCGSLVSMFSIRAMCGLLGLERVFTVSLLPKSVTTAIGMALSAEAGGLPALTTAAIILTGILGNVFGPALCGLLRLRDPIAQGVAFGTASHAIGTSAAAERSALAGAVSSLSLTMAGLVTAVVYSFWIP